MITQDVHLVSAVSHAHKRLVGYTANLLTGDPENGGTSVGSLYTGSAWDSPTPSRFSQPIALTKGQWIDYQCQYDNPENRNIAQGLQTTDEMCMFIAPYWPRDPNLDACVAAGIEFRRAVSASFGRAPPGARGRRGPLGPRTVRSRRPRSTTTPSNRTTAAPAMPRSGCLRRRSRCRRRCHRRRIPRIPIRCS